MPETLAAQHAWHHCPAFPRWLLVRQFRQTYTVSRQLTEAERYLFMTEAFRWALNLDGAAFSRFSPRPDGEGITYWWRKRLVATVLVTQHDRELTVEVSYNRVAAQGLFLFFYAIVILLIPGTVVAGGSILAGLRWFLLALLALLLMQLVALAFSTLVATWRPLLRAYLLGILKGFGLEAEAQ